MAVKRNEQTPTKREFIGKGWINTVEKEGKNKGVKYINVALDQDIETVEILKGSNILLWPQEKRDGINDKTGQPFQDADYRVSISEPVAKATC